MNVCCKFLLYLTLAVVQLPSIKAVPTVDDFEIVYVLLSTSLQNNEALARQMVRLAFHDAMGGVDGILDFDNNADEHNGLQAAVDTLDNMYESSLTDLANFDSKADFFSWAYVSAFYFFVSDDAEIPWVPLRYGRSDVDTIPTETIPPSSTIGGGGHDELVDYFSVDLGLGSSWDSAKVATILGAHTLGGATLGTSGFTEDWTDSPNSFDNEYYSTMLDPPGNIGWEQVTVSGGKFEWQWGCNPGNNGRPVANSRGCRELMLNADMTMFYDIDATMGTDGAVGLPASFPAGAPNNCGQDGRIWADCFETRSVGAVTTISSFSQNGNSNSFLATFAPAFGELISRNTNNDTLLEFNTAPANFPAFVIDNNNDDGRGGGGRGGDDDGFDDDDGGKDKGGSFCFSERSMVQVWGVSDLVPINKLRVGNKVLAMENMPFSSSFSWMKPKLSYQTVYGLAHWEPSKSTEFLRIYTSNTKNPLEVTGDHLVYTMNNIHDIGDTMIPIRADAIRVGDIAVAVAGKEAIEGSPFHQLDGAVVSKIETVTRKGLYAPLVMEGTIVVDGILASNYVSLQAIDPVYPMIGSDDVAMIRIPISQHDGCHLFMSPVRIICRLLGPELCNAATVNKEDGLLPWVDLGLHFTAWTLKQNHVTQIVVLICVLLLVVPIRLIEIAFFGPDHLTQLLLLIVMSLLLTIITWRKKGQ